MNGTAIRRWRAATVGLVAILLAGACASATVTPIAGTVTSSPSVDIGATPTPSVGSVSSPTEVTLPATTSPAPAHAPTHAPSHAPTHAPTHPPTPAPTSRAAACTGAAKYKAVFAGAAPTAPFDVYCAVLPAGWSLQGASYYKRPIGDELDASYKGPGAAIIQFLQGANCTTSVAACSTGAMILGPIPFGHLTGQLDLYDATPSYVVYVDPGTTHGYTMVGYGMTQPDFISFAAAMKKVPKV